VFHATGESKAIARSNVAQKAMVALGPRIEAEFERRKLQKEQKLEARKAERQDVVARKAEREESLKHEAVKQEGEGEMGSCTNSDGSNTRAVIEQKPQAHEGLGDAEDGTVAGSNDVNADIGKGDAEEKRVKGIVAARVLKQIRPRVSYAEKVIPDAPAEHKYEAQVAVDGTVFEGLGESLALAKARAAASALSTLFNLSFEYTPRKNFTLLSRFLQARR